VDDAYIASGSPTTNYGVDTAVQVDNSPIKHFLLKFDVTGVSGQTITSAKIRLYNMDASGKGGDFYRVSDNSWQEETVTWNTAPAADTTLLASLGAVNANNWYEVDVTSLVTGDGTFSLKMNSTNTDGAYYSTKEGAAGFAPQLIITTGLEPAATQTPTNMPATTPTATPTPTSEFTPTLTDIVISTDTPTATPMP
jgi:hypothetical protein